MPTDPRTYVDDAGDTHVLSDGANDPLIVYRWRIVRDAGPWRRASGRELRWAMSEAEAAHWATANPLITIEKVPGSEHVRMPQAGGWGCPAGPRNSF
jgi:hypothetical protein